MANVTPTDPVYPVQTTYNLPPGMVGTTNIPLGIGTPSYMGGPSATMPIEGGTSGAGMGTLAGIGAITGAGAGSMALSNYVGQQVGDRYGSRTGNLASYISSPIGAQLNYVGNKLGLNKTFGGGHTNKGSYIGLNANPTDQRAQQILQAINQQQGAGTYGEGRFYTALDQFNQLQNEMNQGKISQSDYVKIADQILPQVYDALHQTGGSGEAAARSIGPIADKFENLLQNYNILKQGQQFFGRDLTPQEIAQATPAFQGPNGITNGNAFLANLAQQYKMNPQLDPGSAINKLTPQDINGQVSQQFQSILGRAPTQDELAHFGSAIKSGQTDAFGLGSFLKQMPEYTNAQDTAFRGQVNQELQNYDVNEFNREKGDVISAYGRNGMAPGTSPSLDYALTDLMGKIASNRSAYLAQLSASQYGGNKDLAVGNYQNSLNQMYGQQQSNLQNSQNLNNAYLQRGWQGQDYQTQMRDYTNFLNNQPKPKTSPFDYLNAGLQLANTGANIYRSIYPMG